MHGASFFKADAQPSQRVPERGDTDPHPILSFEPDAELLERKIVDGIDLVDEHLFKTGQFELPVTALHAGPLFAEASSSGARSRHVGMTHAKASGDFSDTPPGSQYAIP